MKISIVSPNLSGCVSILDCGVTYLATYINERTKHRATIWDYTYKRRFWQEYVRGRFAQEKPDAIGITFTTLYEDYVIDTINFIRANLSKDIPIIVGGIHATLKPKETLDIEGVDIVILGEGEKILADVLDALEGGNSLDGIKGIYYKSKGGVIKQNPLRSWIENINNLPFPNYDLWDDVEKYFYFLGQLWLIGTRGCPYNCTNCEELPLRRAVPGSRYRVRDPRNYVEEIKHHYDKYKDKGFRMAHPFDPVFPLDRNWTKEFCQEYINLGLSSKLPFSIFSRGDTFYLHSPTGGFDEERLQWLVDAGCKEIRIGIEAGAERVRNQVHKKNVTNKQLREAFRYFKKYKLLTIGYNMLGGPTETKKEVIQTFKLNRELNPNKPIFFIYQELTHNANGVSMVSHDHETATAIIIKKRKDKDTGLVRKAQDRATIQFGEPIESVHYSKRWLMSFQYFCYLYFVGKRVTKLILRQRHRLIINFIKFMYQGYKEGANMKIVFAYFLSSCGDNLLS